MQTIYHDTKSNSIIKIILRELLYFFKASQFGFVYALNAMLIFMGLGVLVSIILVNSGDFFINIINFFVRKLSIPDGDYQGSYSLKIFFWYSYLFITLIIYLIQKLWHKKFGVNLIIKTKHQIIAIPILVCLGYSLIIYFFTIEYGFWSTSMLVFSIFAVATITANYYYLMVSYIVKYLDKKLF